MGADRYFSIQAIAAGIKRQTAGLLQTKKQKRIAGMVRKARKKAKKHKYDWLESDWK
jgi:hypothetical protein